MLCVNSCKVDKTAAHHGGEEARVLTVPIPCFIWVIWRQNKNKIKFSVPYWDRHHLQAYDMLVAAVLEDHLFQRWHDQPVVCHWAVRMSWPHEDHGHWTPQLPTKLGALWNIRDETMAHVKILQLFQKCILENSVKADVFLAHLLLVCSQVCSWTHLQTCGLASK